MDLFSEILDAWPVSKVVFAAVVVCVSIWVLFKIGQKVFGGSSSGGDKQAKKGATSDKNRTIGFTQAPEDEYERWLRNLQRADKEARMRGLQQEQEAERAYQEQELQSQKTERARAAKHTKPIAQPSGSSGDGVVLENDCGAAGNDDCFEEE